MPSCFLLHGIIYNLCMCLRYSLLNPLSELLPQHKISCIVSINRLIKNPIRTATLTVHLPCSTQKGVMIPRGINTKALAMAYKIIYPTPPAVLNGIRSILLILPIFLENKVIYKAICKVY